MLLTANAPTVPIVVNTVLRGPCVTTTILKLLMSVLIPLQQFLLLFLKGGGELQQFQSNCCNYHNLWSYNSFDSITIVSCDGNFFKLS